MSDWKQTTDIRFNKSDVHGQIRLEQKWRRPNLGKYGWDYEWRGVSIVYEGGWSKLKDRISVV